MQRVVLGIVLLLLGYNLAWDQDVAGIEHCTAESRMDRRTSCLQSNINYLHQLLTRNAAETTRKLTAAGNEIMALKLALAKLQTTVEQVQAATTKQENKK